MTLHVAVDFGTSSTCVVVSVDGREPQVVMIDGSPVMPSAVFAALDGTLFVGQEAERQAAIDPSRYEPNPKRRIDEGELLLGNTVISVLDVVRAVLERAVTEARRVAGNAPIDLLVLTHPADWGAIRTRVLRQAARGMAAELAMVPEPVAAAVFHAASHVLPDGAALAVLDLGGGTVDVSVVRRHPPTGEPDRGITIAGFQVLATRGDPNFGGADIDQLLLEHVGSLVAEGEREAWRQLMEGRELSDRRRRRVLRQDVRGAKETLSRHTYTDVPMPPPFADAHVTRDDLERLIAKPLRRSAALTMETVLEAGLRADQLSAVFLVGGSSRIPLMARLVYQRVNIVPTTLDQPETVVARGALRAVAVDPMRTGGLPAQQPRPPQGQQSQGQQSLGQQRVPARPVPAFQGGPPGPPGLPGVPGGPASANQSTIRYPVGPPMTPPAPIRQYPAPTGQPAAGQAAPAAPLARKFRRRRAVFGLAGAVVLVAAVIGGVVLFTQRGSGQPAPPSGQPTSSTGELIAQYDYKFTAPPGWRETASNSSALEVQITPTSAPAGGDAIYVREFQLSYDSTANRNQAVQELQPKVSAAGYLNFTPAMKFAGKTVAYYQEPNNGTTVDWYVLFQGKVQVSIGCQYTPADQAVVAPICQQVVGGITIS